MASPLVRQICFGKAHIPQESNWNCRRVSRCGLSSSSGRFFNRRINADNPRICLRSTTMSALCSHFERCELAQGNAWRSYSTKKCYAGYLKRWIVPQWGKYELRNIKTIEVESWLRTSTTCKGQLCEDPRRDVRSVQSRLPIRTL